MTYNIFTDILTKTKAEYINDNLFSTQILDEGCAFEWCNYAVRDFTIVGQLKYEPMQMKLLKSKIK